MHINLNRGFFYALSFVSAMAVLFLFSTQNSHAFSRSRKNIPIHIPVYTKPSDPLSSSLSPLAVGIAELLDIENSLRRYETMRKQLSLTGAEKPSLETKQDFLELKIDMIAAIEQARLDIDFVAAELEDEHARNGELFQACNDQKNERINRANINAFRTNGVLWAVAEGLDIPTYKHPKYSISSGTIGIIAGVVPSLFSLYASHVPQERYTRAAFPNMLCKIFEFPTSPRIEYPKSIWAFLSAKPPGELNKSRKEILMSHWIADKNIYYHKHLLEPEIQALLAGTKQEELTVELLGDRILMLNELKSVILQMNRPLMELMMLIRGQKEFIDPNK